MSFLTTSVMLGVAKRDPNSNPWFMKLNLLLVNILFFLSISASANICKRSESIVTVIEKELSLNCTEIGKKELSEIYTLSLQGLELTELKKTDFIGFSSLERVYLSRNKLKSFPGVGRN